jgi:hypothetical protein
MYLCPHLGYPFLLRYWLSILLETILDGKEGVRKYKGVHLPIGVIVGGHAYFGAKFVDPIE